MTVNDSFIIAGREIKQFYRRPIRVLGLVVQPLIWLVMFGFGIRRGLNLQTEYDYVTFILPGIMCMNLLYAAPRGGVSVLRDRHSGFLKSVLVAPVRRPFVLAGLSLGVVTRSVIQASILLCVGLLLSVDLGGPAEWAWKVPTLIALLFLIGLSLVNLAIGAAWMMDDPQTFGTTANWLIFPLFLLSGALFPIQRLSGVPWLQIPMLLNPLSYGVDALRQVLLGPAIGHTWFFIDVGVILGFFLLTLGFASNAFNKAA